MPATSNLETFSDLPVWLNRQYIEDAIRLYARDNTMKIVKLNIIPATAKGENYVSVMCRIQLEYVSENDLKSQKCSYILKLSIENGESDIRSKTFKAYNVYETEIAMYDCILPKLKNILHKIGIDDSLFADTIKADYNHNCLILEDLSIRNYVMAERKNGVNKQHAKLILEKMAKIHAASAVLNEMSPGIFKNFDRGLFNKHANMLSAFFIGNLEACSEAVSSWNGFEYYGEKLLKLKSKLMEYEEENFEPQKNHLNVLIHGDLWVNNALFIYNNDNEPIDVVFIDFQFSRWSSPALDLHHVFHTSLAEDVKHNNLEELVQFYYQNLANTLRMLKFGGKIPTLKEFWIQYKEKNFHAFVAASIIHPLLVNEKEGGGGPSIFLENDERSKEFKRFLYRNVKVENNLKHFLPIFDRQGLLDVN